MSRRHISSDELTMLKERVSLPSLIGESVALQRETSSEYVALCPFHAEKTPSFRVWPDHYHCFGCGEHGDAVAWLMTSERMSFRGAVRHLREWSGSTEPATREIDDLAGEERDYGWKPLVPVPSDAPDLLDRRGIARAFNPKRQGTSWERTRWRPTLVHPYCSANREIVGYVLRVEKAKGGKFTPAITFRQHVDTGERRWCVLPIPGPRPLYGLDRLNARPRATVLLVEGEKTADAAQRLLPSLLAMTWAGGSKAYHLTDFAPLCGRKVVCVPDADREGRAAFGGRVTRRGKRIPGILDILAGLGADARRVDPPIDLPDGWDLADAEAEGWDTGRALAWIKANLVKIADAA
jgi:putative DNA primase/helicase